MIDDARNRISRRTALKRVGAGAALAWTAPVIASGRVPAFAQTSGEGGGGGVPYGSCGWLFMQVPPGGGAGFENGSGAGFGRGCAPFGSEGLTATCPALPPPQTNWDVNTDMLLLRTVTIPAGATSVNVGVAIDNDVTVFWDGVLIGSNTHGGCATFDSFVYAAPTTSGPHTLAVRGHDFGVVTFLDVSVVIT